MRREGTMQLLADTHEDGVRHRIFAVGDATGGLWTRVGASEQTILFIAHAEMQNKDKPVIHELARSWVESHGYAVVVVDAPAHGGRPRTPRELELIDDMEVRAKSGVPMGQVADLFHGEMVPQAVREWREVLDQLRALDEIDADAPVGFWGVALGSHLGIPFLAEEPRIAAAVVGLVSHHLVADAAPRVTVPLVFLMQWDDEAVPRESALALFDALGSDEKTLHANRGGHLEVPEHESAFARRYFAERLLTHP